MDEALTRGDRIVCCFRRGHEGNPISIAPDGRIAILDRAHRESVQEGAPYVCTVKAVGKGGDGPRSYVVRLERPLAPGDYGGLQHADFQRLRLRLGLSLPTWFRSLRSRTVDADVEEETLREGGRPVGVLVRLRHGEAAAELEATPEEAVRRGLRLNAFVPDNHGDHPAPARLRHPAPPAAPGWRPRGVDTVGYLCRST